MVKKNRGFTLMELMIIVALLGIIALMTPRLLIGLSQFYAMHSAKVELESNARTVLDLIDRFLRQGVSSSVVIDQYPGQPPCSRITFNTASGQTIQFYQLGNELFQVQSSTSVIARNLTFASFTYPRSDDPTMISASFGMSKQVFGTHTPQIQASLANIRVMN